MSTTLSEPSSASEFKAGETYRTRDGRVARVYAVDCGGKRPIHGAIQAENGEWGITMWTREARFGEAINGTDLLPPTRRVWIAVWRYPRDEAVHTMAFDAKAEAEAAASTGSRIRIDVLGPIDVEAPE